MGTRHVPLVVGLWMLGLVGCRSGDGAGASESDHRTAAVYSTVIREIAEAEAPATGHSQMTYFIEGAGGYDVPLEVQVQVVDRLKHVGHVRFIDERTEAVDATMAREPVRRNGLLILVFPVTATGERIEVVANRYLRLDDVLTERFTLEESDGEWKTVGKPELTPTTATPIGRRRG